MTAGSRSTHCNFNADSVPLSLVLLPSCFRTGVCGKVCVGRRDRDWWLDCHIFVAFTPPPAKKSCNGTV